MFVIIILLSLFIGPVASAEDHWKIDQGLFLGTHKSAYSIVNGYDKKLGRSSGSSGGSSSSGGDKAARNYKIKNFLTLGYSISSSVAENSLASLSAEAVFSISAAQITVPEGIGVFIEPVSLKSYALEIEPRILVSNQMFEDYVTLKIGYGLSFVRSRDKFRLGGWEFTEYLNASDGNYLFAVEKKIKKALQPMLFLEFKKFKTANHVWAGLKIEF